MPFVPAKDDMSDPSSDPPPASQRGSQPYLLREAVRRVQEYAHEHPDDFAGMYVRDGTLHVGFTRDVDHHVAEIRRDLPPSNSVKPFSPERTYSALATLRDHIVADRAELARASIELASVGVDTCANKVAIVVEAVTPVALAELGRRYGSRNIVVRGGGRYRAL
jgi:hypothetical protein